MRFKSLIAGILLAGTVAFSAAATDERSPDPIPPTPINAISEKPAVMTPVPSREDQAQLMGGICRWGYYYCYLAYPLPVGSPCCCPYFCGAVSFQ